MQIRMGQEISVVSPDWPRRPCRRCSGRTCRRPSCGFQTSPATLNQPQPLEHQYDQNRCDQHAKQNPFGQAPASCAAVADELQRRLIARNGCTSSPHGRDRPGRFSNDARPLRQVVPLMAIEAVSVSLPIWKSDDRQALLLTFHGIIARSARSLATPPPAPRTREYCARSRTSTARSPSHGGPPGYQRSCGTTSYGYSPVNQCATNDGIPSNDPAWAP
jgi:hypothetical protein